MTCETKTTIQLSDIKTIEFECRKCGGIISMQLNKTHAPITKCFCSDQAWMSSGGDLQRDISNLIELMKRYSKSEGEPFILRFGLSCNTETPKAE